VTPKITLIGLGNILLQDEGVGVHAIRHIQKRYETPPELEIVDGGTSGLDLLPFIEGRDRVLFVDAVRFDQEPGHIGILENEEIPALFPVKSSLHHLGLTDVLATAHLLGTLPPEICLIGVQPYSLGTDLELSPRLQDRLEDLVEQVIAKLQDWGLSCRLRPGAWP
jgi:hydrogenase maturation protease